MDWRQLLIVILAYGGLFLWSRTESRSDNRHLEAALNQNIAQYKASTDAMLKAIQDEIKDFHGRLCSIEERNRRP